MKHSRREDVWTNRGNLDICTKGKKSEKPDGIRKTQGCFGQSLNTALAIELVTLAIELVTLAIELVTLAGDLGNRAGDLGNRAGDLGPLGGQSNRRQGSLTRSSPAPGRSQPYTHSWQSLWNDSGNLVVSRDTRSEGGP